MADDLIEERLTQIDFALPKHPLVRLAFVPPKLSAVRDLRTCDDHILLILVDQRDMSTEEAPHLVAEPGPDAADRLHAQRSHELRERLPQDQFAILGPYCLSAHPGQQEPQQRLAVVAMTGLVPLFNCTL